MKGFAEKKKAWVAANPLRIWRLANGLTQQDVAGSIGVSFHSIYNWETGMASPSAQQIQQLSSLTKIKSLAKDWVKWHQERPRLTQEADHGRKRVVEKSH